MNDAVKNGQKVTECFQLYLLQEDSHQELSKIATFAHTGRDIDRRCFDGHIRASFCLFSYFSSNILTLNCRILTWIIGVKGYHADHWTICTSTAQHWLPLNEKMFWHLSVSWITDLWHWLAIFWIFKTLRVTFSGRGTRTNYLKVKAQQDLVPFLVYYHTRIAFVCLSIFVRASRLLESHYSVKAVLYFDSLQTLNAWRSMW